MIENLDKELREKTQKCEQLRDSISKTKLYMSSYKCPNCDVSVKMLNGKLCLHDDNFDISGEVDDIDKLESEYAKLNNRVKDIQIKLPTLHSNYKKYNEIEEQIKLYEEEYEEIPNLKDIKEDLDNLIRYKNSQKSLEEKKCDIEDKIKNKKYSSTINNFENDIKSMKKSINYIEKSLKNCNCNYEEEEELREVINEVKNLDKEILELSNSSDKFTKLKEEHVKTIETWITKHKNDYDNNVRSVSDIEKDIKEEKSKINNFKEIIEICVSNLEKIDKYLENKKEIDRYNEWSKKVTESRKKEKKSRKDLSCIMKLKEKILEAESIAMINVINSINQHAQIYLDDFFPVEPISVRLLPFKESKKSNKPQINVQIEYKGQDCGIDSLSGGELSRVVLAFTLALGEMFNVPLVMLDECTASLDQEMTTIVVESIKEHFTDKLVIIVAHQVIEGAFDSVLTIK
jgi:DNA repair exonuclease SbcCD ATPase subunit